MKIIFASDSFKGSLSSAAICALLEAAAHEVLPDAQCVSCLIADGGEGTLDAIGSARTGKRVAFPAHDGLMRPIEGEVFICEGKAFIEAASTCGLTLLEDAERNPLATTSFGVGESIRFALDQKCSDITVGLGGSCTNDGGMGCLRALGVRFLDTAGRELAGYGSDLSNTARIDTHSLHPGAQHAEITVMSDVDNPLLGPNGATWVFGRQKGADDNTLDQLEASMARFAKAVEALYPDVDFSTPGFGAAGGLGTALSVFLGARIHSGVEELLSIIGFDSIIEGADLVITGEGKLDGQSLQGKAISGVIEHARHAGIPVAAICGTVALDGPELDTLGLSRVIDISAGQALDYAMAHAESNYLQAAKELFLSLRA